jgi:hypothetical protein
VRGGVSIRFSDFRPERVREKPGSPVQDRG